MYYRFSVDDNIRVLKELTEGEYTSVFKHPYLKMYKDIHEKYGTKFQLNVYLETDGFDLSMMTDRYKAEWEANSHWLRFSFHSRADAPEYPYRDSGYEEVYRDCSAVHREIIRFAGEKCLSYFTTIHYCQASPDAIRALKDCGIRGMVGLYKMDDCYGRHFDKFDMPFVYDEDMGMYLFCNDIILNLYSLDGVETVLREDDHKPFTEVMIHEQYFYEDFFAYKKDFYDIVETAVKHQIAIGRKSVWLEELVSQI